jgi:hypothetical protein
MWAAPFAKNSANSCAFLGIPPSDRHLDRLFHDFQFAWEAESRNTEKMIRVLFIKSITMEAGSCSSRIFCAETS